MEMEPNLDPDAKLFHPSLRTLSTLLPATIILLGIAYDLIASLPPTLVVKKAWKWLMRPFHGFMTLDDLLDPIGPSTKVSNCTLSTLFALATVSFVGWLGCLAFGIYADDTSDTIRALIFAVCWCYVALKLAIMRPRYAAPYFSIAFAITCCFFFIFDFSEHIFNKKGWNTLILDLFSMMIPALFVWIAGTLPLQTVLPSMNVAGPNDIPSNELSCPEDGVNLWSWSTFTFVEPILNLANQRTLTEGDVWSLSPFFKHQNIFTKFLAYRTSYPTHSLLRFLLVSNSLDLILDILLELWSAVIGFVPPYALQHILAALSTDSPEALRSAYFWTIITFVAHISFAQVDLFQGWHTRRCYERTRGQMFCLLHFKSLKRYQLGGLIDKNGELGSADLGKIVNLMQGDTYAVAQRFWDFSRFCTTPVRIAISLIFLYHILGWSGLSGVLVISVAFAVNYPLAQYDISVTRKSWKAKDSRMNMVNELLQNIRFLKFYGWEYSWAKKARDARETELLWRVKGNIVQVAISFIWTWLPSATALTSFLCYTVIAGEPLTVSKAFTSLALFGHLQGSMTALPAEVFAMLHAYVSMQRIEAFLQEEEVDDWACSLSGPVEPRDFDDDNLFAPVGFSEAIFRWPGMPSGDSTSPKFELGPLDVKFVPGAITIISGATASGKTALLAALLGEMKHISGDIHIDKRIHKVALCAQNPWLEHATIRDNITFGTPFNDDRYQAVLEACALGPDLAILDAGDLTEIGEKGITLSGGQRARVALARAMYSQAEVILLDDPLAAVDMHTADHLVTKCLGGELARNRTIILVTHHLTLCLPIASYVLKLDNGKILYQGTISELESKGLLLKIIEAEEEPFPEAEPLLDKPKNDADPLAVRNGNTEDAKPVKAGKLIEAEAVAEGRVSLKTYLTYFKAGGVSLWALILAIQVAIRAINSINQIFLARWGEAYEGNETHAFGFLRALTNHTNPWFGFPPPNRDVRPWLIVFLGISASGALALMAHLSLGYYISIRASRFLFDALLQRLTRAPVRFFDTTPIGRILNRFTTDMNTIDNALQSSARDCLAGILKFLVSFGVILYIVPSFVPYAVFIAWLYIRLAPWYIRASRDLRRLESVSLSPAFAGFDELLRGIVHIRAFAMENRYQERFYARVDNFQSFDHVYWLVSGWLRWRYDCEEYALSALGIFLTVVETVLGSVVVFAATLFALWSGVTVGSAAVVIVQAGIFADASRQLVSVAAQLELNFNSVKRVIEYLDVPQEAPAIVAKFRAPAYWPSSSGNLVVDHLVIQYAPHLPPVLHDLSFTVNPSEKIGVVGRTGSGKSTLAMSLLRMIEPADGRIFIDGIDISKLGLEDLRNRITIVSQDVSLFSGTIRSNLDPQGILTTAECIQVLERCQLLPLLKYTVTEENSTILDMIISQDSLSAGEKQLLALARAILRRTNIIIMDEATSQVDSNLDDKVQRTLREELAGAIIITIAHRLKTVMDYDRIMVLDKGRIVEFDTPVNLLNINGGVFREMCRKSAEWHTFLRMVGTNSNGEN